MGAVDDIKIKNLRILHRDVFEQEPIFIFKALYYIAKYGLSWDPMTESLWKKSLKDDMHLKLNSKEINAEIKLVKKEKNGKDVLKLLEDYIWFLNVLVLKKINIKKQIINEINTNLNKKKLNNDIHENINTIINFVSLF